MDKQAKREIIKEYKQIKKPMGVFQIKNEINGRVLIGNSRNLENRYNSYVFQLNMGNYRNKALQEDWNKYGEKSFTYSILEEIEQDDNPFRDYNDELKSLEEKWLEKLQPFDEKGYNKKPVKK